jgi:hypothetical protein
LACNDVSLPSLLSSSHGVPLVCESVSRFPHFVMTPVHQNDFLLICEWPYRQIMLHSQSQRIRNLTYAFEGNTIHLITDMKSLELGLTWTL